MSGRRRGHACMVTAFDNAAGHTGALSSQSTGPRGLPEVLMDEGAHLLERLLSRRRGESAQQTFALPLEDGHVDLATSLAVLVDELIEVRARMPRLVLACQAQRGRQCRPLPFGQETRRGRLGHGLFRLPVLV